MTSSSKSSSVLQINVGKDVRLGVVYTDIVGSTSAVSRMKSSDAARWYQTFYDELSRTIDDFGGYVLRYVGDSVIGFFIEDGFVYSTDLTIMCGRVIQEVVKRTISPYLVSIGLPPVNCRIGADFGEARVVSAGASGIHLQLDLLGNTMNVAAKICSKATASDFFIGHQLWSLAHNRYRLFSTKMGDLNLTPPYPYYKIQFAL